MNAQAVLEQTISTIQASCCKPSLLLHACCAPCASYVLEYLAPFFDITVFFYNPNIYPQQEYSRRLSELRRFLAETHPSMALIEGPYHVDTFYRLTSGHEADPERGHRCARCYRFRLEETMKFASAEQFDFFTTTLSISPHKDAAKLNETGLTLAQDGQVRYLVSDFKKKNGYHRSLELSKQYGLYRQEYCGCEFSARARGV